jgi:hypothetical protein
MSSLVSYNLSSFVTSWLFLMPQTCLTGSQGLKDSKALKDFYMYLLLEIYLFYKLSYFTKEVSLK